MTLQEAVSIMKKDEYVVIRRDCWSPKRYLYIFDDNIMDIFDYDTGLFAIKPSDVTNDDWSACNMIYKPASIPDMDYQLIISRYHEQPELKIEDLLDEVQPASSNDSEFGPIPAAVIKDCN